MRERGKAMVVASLVADALALGAHWIYDVREIDEKFGRVEHYLKPSDKSYHPTKDRGEFTHYGDQTLLLLKSVAENGRFDLAAYAAAWRAFFADYHGYFDQATKATLRNFKAGISPEASGSQSSDLAGAARIAPLVYRYREDWEELARSVRAQTAMTHNHPQVVAGAEFFARVAWKVLRGTPPAAAMEEVGSGFFADTPLAQWVAEGLASRERATREAIRHFGQMCGVEAACPATVHLIARYEGRLRDALVENVMAGGDSAGRGLLVGMILGAQGGWEAVPAEWVNDLKYHGEIMCLLGGIG